MKIVFITGTDTGIGKTIISAGLFYHFSQKKSKVGLIKLVATGVKNGFNEDVEFYKNINLDLSPNSSEEQCLFEYSYPASPHLAAEIDAESISIDKIKTRIEEIRIKYQYDILFIEGAGGLMVPLTRDYLISDFIQEIQAEVLLVTANRLGTVNHTLLSYDFLEKRGINCLGIVINDLGIQQDKVFVDNEKVINQFCQQKILFHTPYFFTGQKQGEEIKKFFSSIDVDW